MSFRLPPPPPPPEAAPQNGQGWGFEFGAATPRPRTGPACSRKVTHVCVCQLPVCLSELCKQLWLNALETLPNDRLNPQGRQASVVKDYINVLKSPSTTLRRS